jgi:hypothetical protein
MCPSRKTAAMSQLFLEKVGFRGKLLRGLAAGCHDLRQISPPGHGRRSASIRAAQFSFSGVDEARHGTYTAPSFRRRQ